MYQALSNIHYSIVKSRGVNVLINKNQLKQSLSKIYSEKYNSLVDYFQKNKRILIGVNDNTRLTPTYKILKFIDENIYPLSNLEIEFLIATGAHGIPSREDINEILGTYATKFPVNIHEAKNSPTIFVGETSRGTKVKVNKIIDRFEAIFYIGSVEPHYFAGFTGNRKFILPGISSYETIVNNHKLALLESSQILKLNCNPVHLDMMDALNFTHKYLGYKIMGLDIIGNNHFIFDVVAGDLDIIGEYSSKISSKIYCQQVISKADIIIAKVEDEIPDMYQAFKAFENNKNVLKNGGIIIIDAKCPLGIGPSRFIELLTKYKDNLKNIFKEIQESYQLGDHKAYNIAKFLTETGGEILFVSYFSIPNSENLPFKIFNNVDEAITYSLDKFKNSKTAPEIIVVEDATNMTLCYY